jgi:hypothetical protein
MWSRGVDECKPLLGTASLSAAFPKPVFHFSFKRRSVFCGVGVFRGCLGGIY